MIILDSYAVLALLKGEPAAIPVRDLLAHQEEALLTALGVAEVVDQLVRVTGVSEDNAALDLAQLGLADGIPVDADLGLRAGLLRARQYHRRDRAVSLADCVAAETARTQHGPVATADPHLLDMCRDEAIGRIALPESSGNIWLD